MKCDDVLTSLESGGPIRRYFARKHLSRCQECTAVTQHFLMFRQELSQPVQVQPKDRLTWQRATGNEVEVVPRWSFAKPQVMALASLTAALLLLASFVLWDRSTQQPDQPALAGQSTDALPVTAPAYSLNELIEMETGLDRVSDDLARLERAASLLEARRQARALTAAFDLTPSTADEPVPRKSSSS